MVFPTFRETFDRFWGVDVIRLILLVVVVYSCVVLYTLLYQCGVCTANRRKRVSECTEIVLLESKHTPDSTMLRPTRQVRRASASF